MIHLDGSTLEGGGQLTRVALTLSAITGLPIHVTNIRAGRGSGSIRRVKHEKHGKQPQHNVQTVSAGKKAGGGLKESHLAALLFLAKECQADVDGAEVGSTEITFRPSRRNPPSLTKDDLLARQPEVIELKNPGSVWLIFQAIFPYIVFRLLPSQRIISVSEDAQNEPAFRIRLKGGTNVPKAMSSEYMQQVFCPIAQRVGLPKVDINVVKRGWTTGRAEVGEVEIAVYPPSTCAPTEDVEAEASIENEEPSRNQGFILPPFELKASYPRTITSIAITTLTGSPPTASTLESTITQCLRAHPLLTSHSIPITVTNSPSGDERRLYILIVLHLSDNSLLGRDYLSPGRSIASDTDRRKICREASTTVVADMVREVERGGGVDEFTQDQLVVFQALCQGRSHVDGADDHGGIGKRDGTRKQKGGKMEDEDRDEDSEIEIGNGSLHTRTVRWVCRETLGTKFDGSGGCEGGGFRGQEDDELAGDIGGLSLRESAVR
jgi:RNA 3'-terminal phosphate cyclase (ATP)